MPPGARANPPRFSTTQREAELYAIAIETLEAAGYEQYEISNFARRGHRCAHNLQLLGERRVRRTRRRRGILSRRPCAACTRDRWTEYVAAALEGKPIPSEAERLEGRKRVGEAVMLALRTAQGVGLSEFKERYGIDVMADYAPVVTRFAQTGLLERVGDTMRLTPRGRFLANDVCGAFITFE